MPVIQGGNIIGGARAQVFTESLGSPALGATTAVMAAFTDIGKYMRFYNASTIWSSTQARKITATFGGTAGDIKAIQVEVVGTDAAGDPLTESLPAATVNTAGTVTSVGSFKTITQITIPAHDGTGATTSIGVQNAGTADVLAAWTDVGYDARFKTATITNPAVCRNLTATSAGTAGDIAAIQAIVVGTDIEGGAITETLPVFTENSGTTVVGNKAFKTVTYIDLPKHDGTGATTAFGTGAKLGLPHRLARNSVLRAYLNNALEGTAPTIATDATNISGNTASLNTALDGNAVVIELTRA